MPTTQETLVKNGIKIIQISASYERKISDGQYGSMGGFFSMTADVEPVAAIEDQIDLLFTFVREAAAKQLKPEFVKTKAAIAQATDHAVNVETPAVSAPAPVTAPTNVAAPQTSIINTFQIVKMQVAPRADGKIDLKFFEAGHNYPDISTSKSADDAAKLLQATGAWKPEHFSGAHEYTVNFVVAWKNSAKLNSKGNPYKDIVAISAA